MDLTIDKFGRVVIPKPVREGHGLGPGSKVTLTEEGRKIVLNPVQEQDQLVEEDGILVFNCEWPEGLDVVEFIKKQRQERAEQFFPKGMK